MYLNLTFSFLIRHKTAAKLPYNKMTGAAKKYMCNRLTNLLIRTVRKSQHLAFTSKRDNFTPTKFDITERFEQAYHQLSMGK